MQNHGECITLQNTALDRCSCACHPGIVYEFLPKIHSIANGETEERRKLDEV